MYKGIGGSSGYGIGKIVIIKNDMPVYEIKSPENKENEIKRFLQAVDKFIEKTTKMAEHMRKTAGEKNAEIIEGHIIMLSDPFMQDEIKDKINSGMCAEEAVFDIGIVALQAAKQDLDLLPLGTTAAVVAHGAVLSKAAGTLDEFQIIVALPGQDIFFRSEERRVGKECRSRWSPYH